MSPVRTWLRQKLSRRLAFWAIALVAGTLAVGTVGGVAVTAWSEHGEADREAQRHAQQLANALRASLADTRASLDALARSSLVANALSDASALSETVRPMLAEHTQKRRYGSQLLLCDAFGRVIASSESGVDEASCGSEDSFRRVLAEGTTSLAAGSGVEDHFLVWMLPVRLPLTGTNEGLIVVRQPMARLLAAAVGPGNNLGYVGLRVAADVRAELWGAPRAPSPQVADDLETASVVLAPDGSPDPLDLAVVVAVDHTPLPWLGIVGAYALAALVLSTAAGVVATLAARRLTAPLTALGRLAASPEGRQPQAWAAHAMRPDEAGLLARCLQALTEQLAEQVEAQRQARAAAEAASRAKTEFLATMSHELRTPLNAVTGLASLALEADEASRAGHLRQLQRSAHRLRALVDDVLDLTRIESGRLELAPAACTIDELVAAVRDSTQPAASAKRLPLEVELAPGLPAVVQTDPLRLVQVLTNLVGNAVKFTERGAVRLRVAAAEGLLRFEVVDTGIGIAPADLPHVFDAFRQADATTSRRFGGSGLGLTICRRIVELMGGRIEVSSTVGQGSRFTVTLPLLAAEAGAAESLDPAVAAASEAETAAALRDALSGRALLVVDDDEVNRLLTRAMLEPLGLEVLEADGGEAALAQLDARPDHVGLVLMDCHMPRVDGYETTRRIRARPALAGLPVIACTADVLTEDREGCRAAGMDDYVSKPVDREQLVATLHRAVASRREGLAAA